MYNWYMNASQTLASRTNKRIIEAKYIDEVLREEAINIKQEQNDVFNDFKEGGFGTIKSQRAFSVANNTLSHRHLIRQRFIDMKRIKGKGQKPVPVHNKIIWGHFNNIIFKLAYGFTEDVKQSIARNYQIEL
jgi:uncharacterized protein (UPF0335 family)